MKAVIYCRISRDREGRELGVERQEADCRALSERLGAEVVEVIADNDVSASSRSRKARPGYRQVIEGAQQGRWGLIIAWSSSRLTRRPMELESQIQLAEQHGTRFSYVKSPSFDLNTAHGRMVARVLAAADAAEAEQGAERLKSQKQQAAAAGQWRGGRRPYGYEADGVTVVPAEADVIRQATRDLLAGASLLGTAKRLNAAGVRTATGRQWSAVAVGRVVARARNAGLIEAGGEIVGEANWPAIVSRAEWEAARRVLGDPARHTGGSHARRWLGSGLFRCGVCGATLRSHTGSRRHGGHTYYSCSQSAAHVARRADYADELVSEIMISYLSRPDIAAALAAGDPEDTEPLSARALELRNRLDEQAEAFGEGLLNRAQLARNTAKLRAELEQIEARMSAAVAEHPASGVVGADDVRAAWTEAGLDRQRAVIDALAVVVIEPGRKGRPPGWKPGQPYFDPRTVRIDWR